MKGKICFIILFLGVFCVGQNGKLSKDSRRLLELVKEYKNKSKVDSSYYFLDIAKKRIFETQSKDSILLYHTWKIELARFDNRRYLADKSILIADNFYSTTSPHNYDKDILAFYLNRKMAVFMQYHFPSRDTIQLSLKTANEILSFKDSVKNKSIIAYTLNEKAQIYDYFIDHAESADLYREALDFAKKHDLTLAEIDISINLAKWYSKNNKESVAIDVLLPAFDKAQDNEWVWQMMVLSEALYHLYYNSGQHELALKYLNIQFDNFKKFSRENSNNLVYEAESKLRIENQEKQLKSSGNLLLLTSVFTAVLILMLILVIVSRHKIKKKNHQLVKLSEENLFLLGEAHHRINNNLQLIIILISDQIEHQNPQTQQYLKGLLSKIESISLLHEYLYKKEDKTTINIKEYLDDILNNFRDTFLNEGVQLNSEISDVKLAIDFSMYLGILVTELLINSMKHAFKEIDFKQISMACSAKDDCLHFSYQDNGTTFNKEKMRPELVLKICRQLKVTPNISDQEGFNFTFQKRYKN